jgi:hypothetical protein
MGMPGDNNTKADEQKNWEQLQGVIESTQDSLTDLKEKLDKILEARQKVGNGAAAGGGAATGSGTLMFRQAADQQAATGNLDTIRTGTIEAAKEVGELNVIALQHVEKRTAGITLGGSAASREQVEQKDNDKQ